MPAPRFITFDGITDTLSGWGRRLGIRPEAVSYRIQRFGLEKALTMPKYVHTRAWDYFSEADKAKLREVARSNEGTPKVEALIPFVHGDGLTTETAKSLKGGGLFSDKEREKLAAIKARRKLCV